MSPASNPVGALGIFGQPRGGLQSGLPVVTMLEIASLAGHTLGTLGHKPGESQGMTVHVIPQVTAVSTLSPGLVQQFNPDRGLLAVAMNAPAWAYCHRTYVRLRVR